jgi:hypothetical protein
MDKRNQGQKTVCAKFAFMEMLLEGAARSWRIPAGRKAIAVSRELCSNAVSRGSSCRKKLWPQVDLLAIMRYDFSRG